jgi:GNAT superfamily N-acetyltransferase
MAMKLRGMPVPERRGLDWDSEAPPAGVGRINDLAYGFKIGTFGGALAAVPDSVEMRLYQARVDGQPASVLGTIDEDGDCGIYFVATLNECRGGGLARRLLHIALAEARRRGCRTSTLQATRMGFPVYQRLGYEDLGVLQMWERRG